MLFKFKTASSAHIPPHLLASATRHTMISGSGLIVIKDVNIALASKAAGYCYYLTAAVTVTEIRSSKK